MNTPQDAARLRCDGMYYRTAGRTTSFLRFFPDGTVVATAIGTSGPGGYAGALRRWWHGEKARPALEPREIAARMAPWFNAQWSGDRGSYTVDASTLKFFTESARGRVDHSGSIGEDSLVLDSHHHALGHRTANVTYRFVPLES